MDIRNFFGKKGKPVQKGKNPNSSNAVADQNIVPMSSAKDDRKREEKKRSSESADGDSSPSKKRKEQERVEISAEDFFASSSSSSSQPACKKDDSVNEETEDISPISKKRGLDSLEDEDTCGGTVIAETAIAVSKSPSPVKQAKMMMSNHPVDGTDVTESTEDSEELCSAPPIHETPARKPTKKSKAARSSSSSKKPKKEPPLEPTEALPSFDSDAAVPECFGGKTFVFTGVLPKISRDAAQDFVKGLGGRVTGSVSGKTDYLVVGDVLEDGRPYTEGSKYRKAKELDVIVVRGEEKLYGLAKLYNEKAKREHPIEKVAPPAATAPIARAAPPNNPYAKRPANPYARAASKPSSAASNPYASKSSVSSKKPVEAVSPEDPMSLWADKHAPKTTREILGNQENVRKLQSWLNSWETRFNNPKAQGKTFSSPNGPWKAALLSGPPGIGKTTMATLVAREAGRDLLELNASDVRSKKALAEGLGDVTGSQVINFKGGTSKGSQKKRCIIMDEVDGMGAGDRSGMAELIKMIKSSKVPIICICNDRQSQKVRSLVQYCMDLRCRRPIKSVIARRAMKIGEQEGLRVEVNAVEAIVESCGNDIRQVLNCMQMWANKKGTSSSMTYKDVKAREGFINKDEILRVSMFDATRMIVEGRKGLSGADAKAERDSLFLRSDAFFVDYSLMGLNVHQNYLKVVVGQFAEAKRKQDEGKIQDVLEQMHDATTSMSDYALAEHAVRSGDQNWGLLPLCSMLAVKTGYHAGGENGGFLPGYPEFAAWMGKNSTRGKRNRLLQELRHHMNYRVGGDSSELRMCYIPVLRDRFLSLLTSNDDEKIAKAIELMDEYGLDRDDVFENLDEFKMDPKAEKLGSALDSKQKAAFTRQYNQGAHKSQALVAEQGVGRTRKAKSSKSEADPADLDAVNDDVAEESEDEEEDEFAAEKIAEKFMKRGSAAAKRKEKQKGGKSTRKKK